MSGRGVEKQAGDDRERRKKRRMPVSYPPVVFVRYNNKVWHARPVDISSGGAGIDMPLEVEPETPLLIVWNTERSGTMKISCEARWSRKLESDFWRTGVVFRDVAGVERRETCSPARPAMGCSTSTMLKRL
jgi:hypothetical protein